MNLGPYSQKMKRFFDYIISFLAIVIFSRLILFIALIVRLTSAGPILYWSNRVGRCNINFKMPKFRIMQVRTSAVATHLLSDSGNYLTPVGSFLRKSSLDELPLFKSDKV